MIASRPNSVVNHGTPAAEVASPPSGSSFISSRRSAMLRAIAWSNSSLSVSTVVVLLVQAR